MSYAFPISNIQGFSPTRLSPLTTTSSKIYFYAADPTGSTAVNPGDIWVNLTNFHLKYRTNSHTWVSVENGLRWDDISNEPTSAAGFGVTDALLKNGGTLTQNVSLSATPTAPLHAIHKQYADNIVPSQTGNSGKYLATDGSDLYWASVASGSGAGGYPGFVDDGFTYNPSSDSYHAACPMGFQSSTTTFDIVAGVGVTYFRPFMVTEDKQIYYTYARTAGTSTLTLGIYGSQNGRPNNRIVYGTASSGITYVATNTILLKNTLYFIGTSATATGSSSRSVTYHNPTTIRFRYSDSHHEDVANVYYSVPGTVDTLSTVNPANITAVTSAPGNLYISMY